MKKATLGILVALAVVLNACGGGGGDDETVASRKSKDSAERSESNDTEKPDSSTESGAAEEADSGAGGQSTETGGAADDAETSVEQQAYVDALLPAFGDPSMPQEETNCIVRAYVDVLGVERLREVVSPEQLAQNPNPSPVDLGIQFTPEDGAAFYDRIVTCIDVRDRFLGGMTGGSPEIVDCLNREIDDDLLKQYVIAIFIADPEAVDPALEDELTAAFTACAEP